MSTDLEAQAQGGLSETTGSCRSGPEKSREANSQMGWERLLRKPRLKEVHVLLNTYSPCGQESDLILDSAPSKDPV